MVECFDVLPRRRREIFFLQVIAGALATWFLVTVCVFEKGESELNIEVSTLELQGELFDVNDSTKNILKHDETSNSNVTVNSLEENLKNESTWKFSPPPNIFGVDDLGELGKAVKMPEKLSPDVQKIHDDGWNIQQFNQYLSDLISVNRSLPDYRSDYCKSSNYSQNLPATSVIIIFHNEAWSTLLRSVHSVLNRSPEHLIVEVILVDDFSNMEHLKQPLEAYMSNFPKVKILRAPERQGLIKARLRGTVAAKGPVLTFLDSHIECTEGWLEPLLDKIFISSTNVVCPIIETINDTTFEYKFHENLTKIQVGGFDWTLTFNWVPLTRFERALRKEPSGPIRSPTMAGGLFAIDKAFFEKLGLYDPEFDIWGGENLELSFKTWMCGGTLEIIPCSKVGHIYRRKSPYKSRSGVVRINSIRLTEVWMDDYSKYFYKRTGPDKGDFGNITERVQLRKNLNCKSFKWYLDNIYPLLEIPSNAIAYGEIRNLGFGADQCLDASRKEFPVKMFNCHGQGDNQYWELNSGKISRERYSIRFEPPQLMFKMNHRSEKNFKDSWTFKYDTKQLYLKSVKMCLTMTKKRNLVMAECDNESEGQKWQLENLQQQKT